MRLYQVIERIRVSLRVFKAISLFCELLFFMWLSCSHVAGSLTARAGEDASWKYLV